VLITDDETIAQINQTYRQIERATDVLSFPMIDYIQPGNFDFLETAEAEDYFDPDSGELVLGDIILSADHIISQAEAYGHSQQRELGFLTVHSMLHLFGYDHMEDEERSVMENRQRVILNKMKLKR
jgi:probable rRNA maturation factor